MKLVQNGEDRHSNPLTKYAIIIIDTKWSYEALEILNRQVSSGRPDHTCLSKEVGVNMKYCIADLKCQYIERLVFGIIAYDKNLC